MWINGHVRQMYQCRGRQHRLQYRFLEVLQHSTISGQLQCAIFHANGYANMTMPRATFPVHISEMKNMNRNIEQNKESKTIARAIWEGNNKTIMGTDGSVRDPTATCYLFVIATIYLPDRCENERTRWWIPSRLSRSSSATTCWAETWWIQNLLRKFPNHTDTDPPPLQIPVNNNGVVKDVHRTIMSQMPNANLRPNQPRL